MSESRPSIRAPQQRLRAWLVSAGLLAGTLGLAWSSTRYTPDPADRLGWNIRFTPPAGWRRVSPLAGGAPIVAYGPSDDADDAKTMLRPRLYLQRVTVDEDEDHRAALRRFLGHVLTRFSTRDMRGLSLEPCRVGSFDAREIRIGSEQMLIVRSFFAAPRDGYIVAMVASADSMEMTLAAFEALCASVRPVASAGAKPSPSSEEQGP